MASKCRVWPKSKRAMDPIAEILPIAALHLEDVETIPELPAPPEEELGIPVKIEVAKGAAEGTKESLNAPWDDESSDSDNAAPTATASDVEDLDADNLPESDSSDSEPEPEVVTHVINDLGPPFLIDMTADSEHGLKLMVIVSMVSPFADSTKTLIHAGDFLMEVTPTTTIREIKKGMIDTLEICYEDMALVYVGKFLSDARTVEYYMIEDGQSLHLLVESPNKLFKHVFNTFKQLDLSEEKAWFATRGFIHLMHGKYSNPTDDTPTLTDEQLVLELLQLCMDSDETEVTPIDEDDQHLIIHNGSVLFIGGSDLHFITGLMEDDDDDDTPIEVNEADEADDQGSEDEEDEDLEESSDDEDADFEPETPDEEEDEEDEESSDSSDDDKEEQGEYEVIKEYALPPTLHGNLFEWN